MVARPSRRRGTGKPGAGLEWLAFLVPAYALCQAMPLPLKVVRVLSPSRAWLPLSAMPSATPFHALLLAACAVMFLVVFDLSKRFSFRPWTVIIPLIVVAAAQAILGLLQATSNTDGYRDRHLVQPKSLRRISRNDSAVSFALSIPRSHRSFKRQTESAEAGQYRIRPACLHRFRNFIAAFGRHDRILIADGFYSFTDIDRLRRHPRPGPRKFPPADLAPGSEAEACRHNASFPLACRSPGYLLQSNRRTRRLGFALALIPLSIVLARLRAGIRHIRPDIRWVSLACAGSVAATALTSFEDFNLYVPPNMFTLAWILGVTAFLGAWSSRNEGVFFEPTVIVLPPPKPA